MMSNLVFTKGTSWKPIDLGGKSKFVPFPGTSGRGGTVKGAFPGISPPVLISTQQGNSNVAPLGQASQIPRDRNFTREAFPASSTFTYKGNKYWVMTGNSVNNKKKSIQWPQTPFRVAINAGDLLMRQNGEDGSGGGSQQVKGSVGPGQTRYTRGARPNQGGAVNKGNGASGNQHWVYDSSDYIKYKRLLAKNKNYNDISFGGSNNGAYVPWVKSRRMIQ